MNRASLWLAALFVSVFVPAYAQSPAVDLSAMSIEDLMNIEISSASRATQRVEDVPAAVYVLTNQAIRRSGMTSLPDLLRLVPGVQVGQVNSNKWAISIRGFGGLYSNKLLVLVDGRTVFNPLFAGVFWDTEDLMLEDVERIEVIRGPGAAVWGANAVNGVINVITRSAADTPGLLVRAGVGTFDGSDVAIRYGGPAGGNGAYRAYAQFAMTGASLTAPSIDANDRWRNLTSGFRGDWSKGPVKYMIQGSVSAGRQRPMWTEFSGPSPGADVSKTLVGHVLGRWARTQANGATLQLQSFVDTAHRDEVPGHYRRTTVDLDAVHNTVLARRHSLVIGGGFRYLREAIDGSGGYTFNPARAREKIVNAFAQDSISLASRRIDLILGAKVEHESSNGWNLQPTARVMWHIQARQHFWAGISRAARLPSPVDKGIRIEFPPTVMTPGAPPVKVTARGNPNMKNERFVSSEVGYRIDIGGKLAIDVAGFAGRYGDLQTSEPSDPILDFSTGRPIVLVSTVFQNLLEANTRGAEVTARFALTGAWQVDASYSAFHLSPHPDPTSRDPDAATFDGSAPGSQWRAHSGLSIGPRAQADVRVFYVGRLGLLNIPAYTRADVRFEWEVSPRVSVTASGRNLFSPAHEEFRQSPTITSTRVPRSVSLRLTWRH